MLLLIHGFNRFYEEGPEMEATEVSDSTPLYVTVPHELVTSDVQVADLVLGTEAHREADGWRIFNSYKARSVLKGKI